MAYFRVCYSSEHFHLGSGEEKGPRTPMLVGKDSVQRVADYVSSYPMGIDHGIDHGFCFTPMLTNPRGDICGIMQVYEVSLCP